MRIGKITLDGYFNYGNLLQNYALQYALLKYADKVDTIWHSSDNFLPKKFWQWTWKQPIKYLINWKNFRTIFSSGHLGAEMVRQGKFKDWSDRYIHYRKDAKDLQRIANEYDYFITGSDQVWNPYFDDDESLKTNFLMFAPSEKRVSYAASISAPVIPDDKLTICKDGFMGMRTLSLREKDGAELVKRVSGREAEVHVDPTLLLTPAEWDKVSRIPAWYHGGEYILTYFLGARPDATIKKVADEMELPIVNLLDDKVYEHYVTGVDEFLWAIKHASLLYTDSFHGTVFSILYRTPFVVCDRVGDAITEKMGSRIDTLLSHFGLEDRRARRETGYEIPNPANAPDWSKVDDVLMVERKRSKDYFDRIFGKR